MLTCGMCVRPRARVCVWVRVCVCEWVRVRITSCNTVMDCTCWIMYFEQMPCLQQALTAVPRMTTTRTFVRSCIAALGPHTMIFRSIPIDAVHARGSSTREPQCELNYSCACAPDSQIRAILFCTCICMCPTHRELLEEGGGGSSTYPFK
jgi:hypothetical protein